MDVGDPAIVTGYPSNRDALLTLLSTSVPTDTLL